MKAICGGKFDCMSCLELLISGVRRSIYFLFQMCRWRFGKLRVIIHLYFQDFLQRADGGCVLIVKVSLVWGVPRVGRKECLFFAIILAHGYIFVIQELYMELVVPKISYYFE